MTEPLILFEGVSFAYRPGHPVLDQCDFRLNAGERVGLRGPNGCGKTTLLGLVVGLLRPSAGHIQVLGRTCQAERDFVEIRGRVGLLFQDADDQLFCPTVAEDVAFGPLNLGIPRHEVGGIVHRTLELLGLIGYENRIVYHLSGGEKRLVALATVLAMEPEVLLLDEPTAGLDEKAARRVTEILASLPQAMVLVSHDRPFLLQIATHELFFVDGKLSAPLAASSPESLTQP